MADAKSETLTIRLTAEQKALLDRATQFGHYRLSITDVVVRGIELAAKELEEMGKPKNG